MEKMNDLKALLEHEIHDLVSAEEQIIEAMPAMIEKAQNAGLKKALQQHLAVTEKQRTRLDKVQSLLNKGQKNEEEKGFLSGLFEKIGGGEKCKGMEGIITEGQKIMKADMNAEVMDAAIIACSQKIEHYEICGYGTLKAYARELNLKEVESLLEETLNEEYEADNLLTKLALGDINEMAENAGSSNKTVMKKSAAVAKKAPAKAAANPPKKAAAKASAPKKAAAKSAAPKKAGNRK